MTILEWLEEIEGEPDITDVACLCRALRVAVEALEGLSGDWAESVYSQSVNALAEIAKILEAEDELNSRCRECGQELPKHDQWCKHGS